MVCKYLKKLDSGFRRNDEKWCFLEEKSWRNAATPLDKNKIPSVFKIKKRGTAPPLDCNISLWLDFPNLFTGDKNIALVISRNLLFP